MLNLYLLFLSTLLVCFVKIVVFVYNGNHIISMVGKWENIQVDEKKILHQFYKLTLGFHNHESKQRSQFVSITHRNK